MPWRNNHPALSWFRLHILFVSCTVIALGGILPGASHGQEDPGDRLSQFKAAFIYHFIDYIQWPESLQDSVFTIGILGNTEIETTLREISRKRKVSGRNLKIMVFDEIEHATMCHLLFISNEYAGQIEKIQDQLENSNILTVSDTPGLAEEGVAINFALVDDRLKFEINRQRLEQARLQASAQLLKLAILVDEPRVK